MSVRDAVVSTVAAAFAQRSREACFVEYCVGVLVLVLFVCAPLFGRPDLPASLPSWHFWGCVTIVCVTRVCMAARKIFTRDAVATSKRE